MYRRWILFGIIHSQTVQCRKSYKGELFFSPNLFFNDNAQLRFGGM